MEITLNCPCGGKCVPKHCTRSRKCHAYNEYMAKYRRGANNKPMEKWNVKQIMDYFSVRSGNDDWYMDVLSDLVDDGKVTPDEFNSVLINC